MRIERRSELLCDPELWKRKNDSPRVSLSRFGLSPRLWTHCYCLVYQSIFDNCFIYKYPYQGAIGKIGRYINRHTIFKGQLFANLLHWIDLPLLAMPLKMSVFYFSCHLQWVYIASLWLVPQSCCNYCHFYFEIWKSPLALLHTALIWLLISNATQN